MKSIKELRDALAALLASLDEVCNTTDKRKEQNHE